LLGVFYPPEKMESFEELPEMRLFCLGMAARPGAVSGTLKVDRPLLKIFILGVVIRQQLDSPWPASFHGMGNRSMKMDLPLPGQSTTKGSTEQRVGKGISRSALSNDAPTDGGFNDIQQSGLSDIRINGLVRREQQLPKGDIRTGQSYECEYAT
jgi:hypothetical protein